MKKRPDSGLRFSPPVFQVKMNNFFFYLVFVIKQIFLAYYTEFAALFPNRAGADVAYLEQAFKRPRFLFPVSFAVIVKPSRIGIKDRYVRRYTFQTEIWSGRFVYGAAQLYSSTLDSCINIADAVLNRLVFRLDWTRCFPYKLDLRPPTTGSYRTIGMPRVILFSDATYPVELLPCS